MRASASLWVVPTTSGTTRATAMWMATSDPSGARVPTPGSVSSTVFSVSSDFTSSTVTAKPASSSVVRALAWVMPTTSGTLWPPQSSMA